MPVTQNALQSFARKRFLFFSITFSLLLILDQLSKTVAKSHLAAQKITVAGGAITLSYIENPSGFLGILHNVPEPLRRHILTTGVAIILTVFTVHLLTRKNITFAPLLLCSSIIAGGASNLLDRVIQGVGVIDFVSFNFYFFSTGFCNLADIYVLTGSFGLGFILSRYS